MDILFDNYNVFQIKKKYDIDKYLDKIFYSNDNLDIYNFIRISNKSDIYNLIHNKLKNYINDKIQFNKKIDIIMMDLVNKMKKITKLFNYLYLRKNIKDININNYDYNYNETLINIFYGEILFNTNKTIIIEKIIQPIINNTSNEHIECAYNLLISLLFHIPVRNISYYHHALIDIFYTEIEKVFKSNISLNYDDLILDFELIERLNKYINKLTCNSNIKTIERLNKNVDKITYNSNIKTILNKLPIISILSKLNLTKDKINNDYYNIIKYMNINNYNIEFINYMESIIKNIEKSFIITLDKYKDCNLFLDFAIICEIFNILYDYSKNDIEPYSIHNNIIKSCENIFNQDENFIKYIVVSLIILKKKLNDYKKDIIEQIVSNITKIILKSHKTHYFLNILYNSIDIFFKYDINDETINYLNLIMINFNNSDDTNYDKIIKYLDEININKDFNKELKSITINSNYPIDYNICNTIISKNKWKDKHKYNLCIPNEILVYLKTYEEYYKLKYVYKNIEWSLENSFIDIELNDFVISGNIIQISILFIVSNKKSISLDDLISELIISNNDIKTINIIKKNIDILLTYKIILENNNNIEFGIIYKNINLNLNEENIINQKKIDTFDINNTIDCYIIKILKVLPLGLQFNDLLKTINLKNTYFQIKDKNLLPRLEYLIKKDYILLKEEYYVYIV